MRAGTVEQYPVLNDNYVYVVHGGGALGVVDPAVADFFQGGAEPVMVLNTHHHGDHVGANLELKKKHGAVIVGPRADRARIPGIDVEVSEGDTVRVGTLAARVLDVPGHTRGHIAYHFAEIGALFCGDTLFSLGCGRLFEGTPEQMFASLAKFKALPPETLVYCAHEYTAANYAFAVTVDPGNAALLAYGAEIARLRHEIRPTIPSTIARELACNPFMRARDARELGELRARKDRF